jgi:uncharacterized protein (DUF2336 family)
MQYALAVAGREYLSEPLSELLAASGEVEVVGRLVGNQGAPLSTETLRQIAIDYDNDRRVQEPLIRRPALPYELVDQLVTVIGKRLEWDLICQRRMSADEAQRLVAAKQMLQILAREQSERSLERELRQRMAAGELDAEAVLGFLRDGEISRFEAALTLLANLKEPTQARELIYGTGELGLATLCIRAGFATPYYVVLRMALDLTDQWAKGGSGEPTYSAEMIRFVRDEYERIRVEAVGPWFNR